MTNGPRNSINDGWRTRISLRRALCLTIAALSFSTLVSFTPDSAIAASANGTQGTQVVDASGAVWTFDGERTLRDGVWVAGGIAREVLVRESDGVCDYCRKQRLEMDWKRLELRGHGSGLAGVLGARQRHMQPICVRL